MHNKLLAWLWTVGYHPCPAAEGPGGKHELGLKKTHARRRTDIALGFLFIGSRHGADAARTLGNFRLVAKEAPAGGCSGYWVGLVFLG